jgi:replication initiation protein RepC
VAILQRAEAIKSPGGYLRALTEKARAGQFSLGPVLMALLRAKLKRRMAGAEIPSPRRRA